MCKILTDIAPLYQITSFLLLHQFISTRLTQLITWMKMGCRWKRSSHSSMICNSIWWRMYRKMTAFAVCRFLISFFCMIKHGNDIQCYSVIFCLYYFIWVLLVSYVLSICCLYSFKGHFRDILPPPGLFHLSILVECAGLHSGAIQQGKYFQEGKSPNYSPQV